MFSDVIVNFLLIAGSAAFIYDQSRAEERHVRKTLLINYCSNMCVNKCNPITVNGTLTCEVPPCPQMPCDSGCFKRCLHAEKFLPHWLP